MDAQVAAAEDIRDIVAAAVDAVLGALPTGVCRPPLFSRCIGRLKIAKKEAAQMAWI